MTLDGSKDEGTLSIRQTSDSGYILAGGTFSFSEDDNDAWLIKISDERPKGDLNGNGISADAGDLILMKRASIGEIII